MVVAAVVAVAAVADGMVDITVVAVEIAALLVWDSDMEHGEDMDMVDVDMDVDVVVVDVVVAVAVGDVAEDVDSLDLNCPKIKKMNQNNPTNNQKTILNHLKMTDQVAKRTRKRLNAADYGEVVEDLVET